MKKIITSESVNCGHPDKTCDIIADSFLDEALKQDVNAQMAVECAIKDNQLYIYGEKNTTAKINFKKIAADVLKDIGYKNKFKMFQKISHQSGDIFGAINKADICANDQGIIYGYATNETKEYMPLPILLSHKLMQQYDQYRRQTDCFFADAKSQVSVLYEDNKPIAIDTILISVSHSTSLTHGQICELIMENVIKKTLKNYQKLYKNSTKIIINPSGKFTIWGSFSDSGCVGRKIVVDSYGGVGRVGGGCFSSKNATKVDRSAAYYARFVAKNIVANGFADICEIQVAYAIGIAEPISLYIETFGTQKTEMEKIYEYVKTKFSFKVGDMIGQLNLLKPIYKQTACFGHFGRDIFEWEKIKPLKKHK